MWICIFPLIAPCRVVVAKFATTTPSLPTLPKCIINMLTYCFIIPTKQYSCLFSRKPYHIFLQPHIYLRLPVLCLIDDYLILSVNICWFHII